MPPSKFFDLKIRKTAEAKAFESLLRFMELVPFGHITLCYSFKNDKTRGRPLTTLEKLF
jgi:hypothetical protein